MEIEERANALAEAGGEGSPAPEVQDGGEEVVETQDQGPDGSEPSAPKPVPYEVESEARGMGWVPQTEWRGDPNAWRPADEFVKRGKEVLPIVRSQLDRERRKVQDLESRLNDLPNEIEAKYVERFKRLEKMNTVALQKQASQIYSQFEAQKRAAVEAGDTAAYDHASEAQRQALADLRSGVEPEPETEPSKREEPAKKQSVPTEVSDWMDRNKSWFNVDPVLTALASAEHGRLLKEVPGLPLEENLNRTLEFVRRKFPEKFGIDPQMQKETQRAHSPQVEGGNRQPGGAGSKVKGWNDLPPEAKAAGEKNINRDGLFLPDGVALDKATPEDIKKARNAYAEAYWSQE